MKDSILLIGKGRVGTALGSCLRTQKIPLVHRAGRGKFLPDIPKARLILIAVKDPAVSDVAKKIHQSRALKPGSFLAHFSGSLSSKVLRGNGCFVFSIHPLKSFAFPEGKCSDFQGIPFIFEGDKKAIKPAEKFVKILGGKLFQIKDKNKILYHAAACIASNFLVTLVSMAAALNKKAGISERKSQSRQPELFFIPLLSSTLKNIEKMGIPGALTGPIERGDFSTVTEHIKALKKNAPEILKTYRILGLETLKLARLKGLSEKESNLLKMLLKNP